MIGDRQTTAELEREIAELELLQRDDCDRRERHAIAGAVYTERIEEREAEIMKLTRIVERRKSEDHYVNWINSRPSIPVMQKPLIILEIEYAVTD